MEEHEQILRSLLIGKTLNDIEIFDTDLLYVSPDMDHEWIVDGGIQFKLDDGFFCFAYTTDQEFFNVFLEKVDDLGNEFEVKSLGARDVDEIDQLIGSTITEVTVQWNHYVEMVEGKVDEFGEKLYMPFEIILYFSNQSFLQIATVDYNIKGKNLQDLEYNSEGELLIAINRKIDIAMPQ